MRYGERGARDLARALPSPVGAGPGEEGQDTSRGACCVAEVEVVGAGIVEVDGSLHEAESENPGVEVQISLGVARDRGHMMDAANAAHAWHMPSSSAV